MTTTTDTRVQAAEAYVKALRTGENAAAAQAGRLMTDSVVLVAADDEGTGRDNVVNRITGQWPLTPVYVDAGFSTPRIEGEQVEVTADFPAMGAAPSKLNLTFSFDADGKVSRIEQTPEQAPP